MITDELKLVNGDVSYIKRLQGSILLPSPWINITTAFEKILQAFQNVVFVGELRERWVEIKKLQPDLSLS